MKLSTTTAVIALSALIGMLASFASADEDDRVLVRGRSIRRKNNDDDDDKRRLKEDDNKNKDKNNKDKNNDKKEKDGGGGGGGGGGGADATAGGVALPGCDSGTGTCYAKNRCDLGATLVPIWLCMDACFETAEGIMFVYVVGGVTPAGGCYTDGLGLPPAGGGGGRKLRLPQRKEMARIVVAPPDNEDGEGQFTRRQEITVPNERTIPNPLQ